MNRAAATSDQRRGEGEAPLGRRREMFGRLLASNRKLRALADRDPLTGALNRRGLTRFLDRLSHGRSGQRVPVLLVDCDDFKTINEDHGHAFGDETLVEIVHRLRASLRERDPICRVGGDEFLVPLPHTELRAAERIARQVCDRVAASPITVGAESVQATVSIGVAEAELVGGQVGPLLAATRAALRVSKGAGKNRASWDPEETGRFVRTPEISLLGRLGMCGVEHQPIVSLRDGSVVGNEWWIRGPSAELRAPADLFRAARQLGADTVVDLACLRTAVAHALHAELPGRIYFNVLPGSLTDEVDAVAAIVSPLVQAGHEVLLELSLEGLGRCSPALMDAVAALGRVGVGVSLEHAGHGATSLDAILALSPKVLKIRHEWVEALGDRRAEPLRLARALLKVACALELEVGVVGVEKPAELEVARALGFSLAQGRLFAPRLR